MGRDRTRIERLEQLNNSSTVSDVTGTPPIVVTTPSVGVRNVAVTGVSGTNTGDQSVGLSMPSEFSVANSPITSSGTIAVTKANQSANLVYAGPPTGAAAAPTFRTLAVDDAANSLWTNAKLANMAAHTVKANITGSAAAPVDSSLSAILDAELGNTQGQIIYRDSGAWNVLGPGTLGQILSTGGSGANPSWTSLSGQFSGLTVPITANFSTFGTVATASDCTTPKRMKFTMASAGGINFGGLTQASISAPYTIDLAFINVSNCVVAAQSSYLSIVLADSGGTPKYRAFGLGGIAQTITAVLDAWTGTASDVRTTSIQVGGQNTTFLRVTNDATTLRYYISNDGLSYVQLFSEAVNTFVTPTKFGIGAINQHTVATKYDIFSWVVTASVLGDAA